MYPGAERLVPYGISGAFIFDEKPLLFFEIALLVINITKIDGIVPRLTEIDPYDETLEWNDAISKA